MTQALTQREQLSLYNETLNSVEAVLHAISAGELLANLPADKTYAASHNAACHLLDMAEERIAKLRQAIDGGDDDGE